MRAAVAFVVVSLASLPTSTFARNFNADTDLIVFGKVKTLKYESFGNEFDLDGQITAVLTITRIVRGRPPAKTLTIKYIAHMERPAEYVGDYHLRRSGDGVWLVCKKGGGIGYICR